MMHVLTCQAVGTVWGQVLWDIIGWGRPYDVILYVTVIKMGFKLYERVIFHRTESISSNKSV